MIPSFKDDLKSQKLNPNVFVTHAISREPTRCVLRYWFTALIDLVAVMFYVKFGELLLLLQSFTLTYQWIPIFLLLQISIRDHFNFLTSYIVGKEKENKNRLAHLIGEREQSRFLSLSYMKIKEQRNRAKFDLYKKSKRMEKSGRGFLVKWRLDMLLATCIQINRSIIKNVIS